MWANISGNCLEKQRSVQIQVAPPTAAERGGKTSDSLSRTKPPVPSKGERGNKMSDFPRASAFNDVTRYPYYNEGKTAILRKASKYYDVKAQKNRQKGKRERGKGARGETRREKGEMSIFVGFSFSPFSRRVSPRFPCENTRKQKFQLNNKQPINYKTIAPKKILSTF